MKYIRLIFILFTLNALSVNAQDVNYYKSIIDTTQNLSLKLTALDSIVSKSFKNDNDLFIESSIQYIEVAKKVDSFEYAAKKAINLQYILTNFKSEPRKAVTIIDDVLAYKSKIKDSFLLGGLYLKRGGANFRLDLKKAIIDYTNALQNFSKSDSLYVADTYLFRGQANSKLGNFVKAGEDYKNAYQYFEALKDYQYMLFAKQGNITMFSMNGFFDKAKIERDLLIEKLITLDLKEYLTTEYYNQALDYKKIGDNKKHIQFLLKAERTMIKVSEDEDNDYSFNFIVIHSKLSEYYSNKYDVEKAEYHLTLVDAFKDKIEGDLISESSYYGSKSLYYKALSDYNKALEFAEKKLTSAKKLNYGGEVMDAHFILSSIYSEMGNYKKSLENKDMYTTIKDSIFNQSKTNSLAYYQTLYETEKKEKDLVEKNTNIKLLEKDNDSFKKLVGISILSTLLIFGLIIQFKNQQNLKNTQEVQEKFSQKLILSQEEERKRISKELHDGLGQNLLVLKNKLISSGDEISRKMVDSSIDELRTIAKDLHPFQLQELGITKAIKYTLEQIDENTPLFITSEMDDIDGVFIKEQEVNIYRIVQECLSNIIKHSDAEACKVNIKKTNKLITIIIKDNGKGFDFAKKYYNVKSLGLKTLRERTNFLNGNMKVQSKNGEGTIIKFEFPIV
ncbi:MAG: signal transduction histidine kinase [Flavobacteriaceae bacterium]